MKEKYFPSNWINQTMSTIQGGKFYINVNGERIQYFKTYKVSDKGTPSLQSYSI
jgi:hypothetical protein